MPVDLYFEVFHWKRAEEALPEGMGRAKDKRNHAMKLAQLYNGTNTIASTIAVQEQLLYKHNTAHRSTSQHSAG